MKLHLGCGEKYLDGYLNVDFPSDNHTVQKKSVADRYCDVAKLDFAGESVDEVRLHHLFEHFSRPKALALLCRWTDWLKVGGKIHIETPDWDASILTYLSPLTSYDQREQILRHLFGSHEAPWAVHWDAWHQGRFKKVLGLLGYEDIRFFKSKWGVTKNIEVTAKRSAVKFSSREYEGLVKNILSGSLIKPPIKKRTVDLSLIDPSELHMLDVWMREWADLYFIKG